MDRDETIEWYRKRREAQLQDPKWHIRSLHLAKSRDYCGGIPWGQGHTELSSIAWLKDHGYIGPNGELLGDIWQRD